jgi:hypothetical protein
MGARTPSASTQHATRLASLHAPRSMTKILAILIAGLVCEAIGVVFLSK